MDRRQFGSILGAVFGGLAGGLCWPDARGAEALDAAAVAERLRAIEAASGARLGVALFDSGSGQSHFHRGDERFPLCSTFKLLAAALVLRRVDQGRERLTRRLHFSAADLVEYSPITAAHAGGSGMTLAALCHAAITRSDNTAGNLLLQSFGGPLQLTAFMRALGDPATRLDRIEPDLNEAAPGDARDTTTPAAMLGSLRQLLLGPALSAGSRRQLRDWLLANQTGATRLRARLPAGWRVADKTGTGAHGTHNDIGMLLPPRRPPLLVAAYLSGGNGSAAMRDAALAEVGRLAASLAA